jgi:hypothetical protein
VSTLFSGLRSVVSSLLWALPTRTFKHYAGSGFVLVPGPRFNHNESSLLYREDGHEYQIPTEQGVHGERYFSIEGMGSLSFVLSIQPVEEKIRIARNIRDGLISQGFDCQVLYGHRPVD